MQKRNHGNFISVFAYVLDRKWLTKKREQQKFKMNCMKYCSLSIELKCKILKQPKPSAE